jgi:hypothetical protein
VHQRADGCFVLFEDEAARDEIIAQGDPDRPREWCEHIWIKPHEVVFGVDLNRERNALLAEFMEWITSRWPADVYNESERPRTVAQLEELNPG